MEKSLLYYLLPSLYTYVHLHPNWTGLSIWCIEGDIVDGQCFTTILYIYQPDGFDVANMILHTWNELKYISVDNQWDWVLHTAYK